MTVSIPGLNVIRSYEGRALRAYLDCVGVPTIGYGNTQMDRSITFKIVPGVTEISAEQAEALLVHSLETQYVPAVDRALPGQPQHVRDGGYSFHYNTGGIGRAGWVKAWLGGLIDQAHEGLMAWNRGGGKVLAGLTRRRAREWQMVFKGDYGPEGASGPTIIDVGPQGQEHATNRHAEALGVPPGVPVAPVPAPDAVPGQLRKGDTGPAVADLQRQLEAAGYPLNDKPGVFGQSTADALALFQAHHGHLTADGRLGPASTAQLQRDAQFRKDAAGKGKVGGLAGALAAGVAWLKSVPAEYYLVGGVALLALFVLYLAWRHRGEGQRLLNQSIGRVVP